MRLTRLGLIAGLVLATTLLVVATPASAHKIRFGRSVGGSFGPGTTEPFDFARGTVGSGNVRCRRNSVVTLWRVTGGGATRVGSANTGADNRWRIDPPGNFPNGDYFLTVRRKVLARTARHHHVCPFLRTGTAAVTNP